jgi:OmpA-OmpF porin, OOP family
MKQAFAFALIAPALMASAAPGEFKDVEDGWLDEPEVVNVATLKQLTMGMTRQKVYHLLGSPHFNEGVNARTWNFIFDLRDGQKALATNCQMQIVYDKGRISRILWNSESCEKAAS